MSTKVWIKYDPATGEVLGWADGLEPPNPPPADMVFPPGFVPSPQAYVQGMPMDAVEDNIYVLEGKIKKYTIAQKKAKKERPVGTKWDNKTMTPADDRTPEQKAIDEDKAISWARHEAYPRIEEFADAYYWQENGNKEPMNAYLAKVKAVKVKYPKKGEVI